MKQCTIPGCEKPLLARGFCAKHWERWRRHGDPLGGRTPNGRGLAFVEQAVAFEGDACLLWPYGTTAGYGAVGQGVFVHRLVCERVHGPKPFAAAEVAHGCGIRLCVNPRHLRWDTHKANMADLIVERGHGPNTRLTRQDVRMIRALALTTSVKEISLRFKVSRVSVYNILAGRTWKHL